MKRIILLYGIMVTLRILNLYANIIDREIKGRVVDINNEGIPVGVFDILRPKSLRVWQYKRGD